MLLTSPCRTVVPSYCPASLSSLTHYVHVVTAADQPPPSLTSYADGWRSQLSPSCALPLLSENIFVARDISPPNRLATAIKGLPKDAVERHFTKLECGGRHSRRACSALPLPLWSSFSLPFSPLCYLSLALTAASLSLHPRLLSLRCRPPRPRLAPPSHHRPGAKPRPPPVTPHALLSISPCSPLLVSYRAITAAALPTAGEPRHSHFAL